MTKSLLTGLFLSLGGAALVAFCAFRGPALAEEKKADTPASKDKPEPVKKKESPSADVFGLTRVHEYHLELTAKEWERMQQVVGGMRFGPPGGPGGPAGPPKPPEKPPEKPGEEPLERHKNAAFGTEFPWAHGEITEDGKTWKNIGIRYKGNASYMASARGLKRNFKIDLDHYDEDLRYFGMKSINLNAGAMDPSRGREALGYAVFRAAGVPAPRTAFAQVTLTVPGKYDKEFVGLYTVVEQVDKTFLKDRFKDGKGLLMKPERLRGIEYLGEDWDRYKDRYQPKHEPSKKEAQRVIEFAKLVNRADDEQFNKEVGNFLDVDEFLRFLAVNALISNLDSFLGMGHNYYIYLNPENSKFVFIPWDLDLSLAGFPMGGGADQQADLSISHPHMGQNKLIDRLLAIPDVKEQYQKVLKDLASSCFTKEKLLKDVDALAKVTKEPLARERKAAEGRKEGGGGFGFGPPGGGMFGRSLDLRAFVEKRVDSVESQLAGKTKGYTPQGGFGPGGRPGGRFGPGVMLAPAILKAADSDGDQKLSLEEVKAAAQRFFQECDKDKKGSIDEKTLAEAINRLMPPPPGFGPVRPGQPPPVQGKPGAPAPAAPGGPFIIGFGPGNHFASVIMKTADARSGKLTQEELVAAAEKLFKEWAKEGRLDEKQLSEGIDKLLPPPQGPPGAPPPPPPAGKEGGK